MGRVNRTEPEPVRSALHSVREVPVIVAEIGSQSVDVQDQSHGAAQQFSEHLCSTQTSGNHVNNQNKKYRKNGNKKEKCAESRTGGEGGGCRSRSLFSPRLCQDVSPKISPFCPPHPNPSSSMKCIKWIIHRWLSV